MDKNLLSRAASLMGTTLEEFVRSAVEEKVQALLAQEARVTLSNCDFLTFNTQSSSAFTPNPTLQNALAAAAKVKCA